MNLRKYIAELKKRHVFKAGLAYLVGAWVFTEVASLVLDSFDAPPHFIRTILIILVIGFPIWLVFSWVYDITNEGIKKTRKTEQSDSDVIRIDKNVNWVMISLLSIAVILLAVNQFRTPRNNRSITEGDEKQIELIAVLPFFNTKSDPETDYLGFAMADQIIGGLVYLQNMVVRPSASIRQYEQQRIDPKTVGKDLQVDYILIGNYLKEGNVIRLNIELIHVHSNKIIWREPLQVDFQSAFELQDIVAREVIEGMNVQFTQKEFNRISRDIPENPLAYEYFLRSISYAHSNEGDQLAIEMLNKSIELDSSFAPAHHQLGDRLHRFAQYGFLDPAETKRAEESYLKALSLNGELLSALGQLSMVYAETDRIVEAVRLTKEMLELNPNNANAHFSIGYIYRYAGLNEEAVEEMEKAISLDPNNQGFRSINITYIWAGEYEKAFEIGKKFKESTFIIGIEGQALFRLGREKEAMEHLKRVFILEPGKLEANAASGVTSFISGNIEEGLSAARKFEEYNLADAEAWYFNAGNYGLLGDKKGCIRCLRRAVDGGFFNYPMMNTDFYLDTARNEPEFQEILEEAKQKHLNFKKKLSIEI